jgi:signal transduction histidine kinase
MGKLIRGMDWSKTPFGAIELWPQSLRTAVSICLTSRFPILIWWGPDFHILYNDAYIPFLGEQKHPRYLGQPGRECWQEIWETIGPMLEGVYGTGEATWSDDFQFFFARKLPREEVYVTFTFGPILSADGRTVEGVFCPCTETTEKIVGARRIETLRKLGVQGLETHTIKAACEKVAAALEENPYDIPFAAIYRVDHDKRRAEMQSSAGFSTNAPLPPSSLDLSDGSESLWPFASVIQSGQAEDVDLTEAGLRLPGGAWPEPAPKAITLPLLSSTHETVSGLVVLGVSPRRPLDADYRTFFDLVAGHIATAIANARAYEEERKRAEALAEIDRAKTVFFSNVSHEFRTPLTLMLGPLEDTLAEDGLPPQAQDRLEVARRNSLRLLKLVNTLLDFSRIEAGRIQAAYEPVDLAKFTTDLASIFRSTVERAGLEFVVDCPPLSEPVYVDREMWEKIVLNLLSNAFKFTFEGEINPQSSQCATRARAFLKPSCRACSSVSTESRARMAAATKAPGSASRSCRNW